jgi:endo-1,4-beta-mannosidase
VKINVVVSSVLLAGLICCKIHGQYSSAVSQKPEFVKISTRYPAYFETTNNQTWVPVMINYVVPASKDESAAFITIENYFRNFSTNGGNAMRIWISSPFLEIEDEKAGHYSSNKFARIDKVLQLAEKYQIRIKFTLQHIRTITTGQAKQPWANSTVLSADSGGPFTDIKEYINTPKGKKSYLDRVRALAEKYKNNTQIFGWELWNEMDAVDSKNWLGFTTEVLDSVKALFPHHLVTQTLGSLHSKDAADRYEQFFGIQNNPYVSLHRYIHPGKNWSQYDYITRPVDSMIFQAMQFAQSNVQNKPIVVNEIGAVEANHAGPSKLYQVIHQVYLFTI